MGHVVVHLDAGGAWQLEDVVSLEAALERVETLRNTDGCEQVRLFEEIALEVRTYYRVAVADGRPVAASSPPASAGAPPAATASPAPVAEVPAPDDPRDRALRSPFDDRSDDGGDDGTTASSTRPVAVADPPPGAFPLASPPVPAAPVSAAPGDDEGDAEAASNGTRRGSRFGRDR